MSIEAFHYDEASSDEEYAFIGRHQARGRRGVRQDFPRLGERWPGR
jgi:hypothetical protein